MRHLAVLIPGYMGFAGSGPRFDYWGAVSAELLKRGIEPVSVPTHPAASIERRAERLRRNIVRMFPQGRALPRSLHLIGHSMGGLDARWLASPAVSVHLPAPLQERLRTVICIAAPHFGTPLADFGRAVRFDKFMAFCSRSALKLAEPNAVEQAWRFFETRKYALERSLNGAPRDILRVFEDLAEDPQGRLPAVAQYLRSLSKLSGALEDMSAERMRRLSARMSDAPNARYISYAAGVRAPRRASLYAFMDYYASRWPKGGAPRSAVLDGCIWPKEGRVEVDARLTDGVAPTLSQLWGETRGFAAVDHYAVIGRPDIIDPPSRFRREGFEALCGSLAEDILSTC